jgi:hypothetical protein
MASGSSVAVSRVGDDPTLILRPVAGANLYRRVTLVAQPQPQIGGLTAFIGGVEDHIGGTVGEQRVQ